MGDLMGPKPIDYASLDSAQPRGWFRRGIIGWVLFIGLAVMLFLLMPARNRQAQHIAFSDFDLLLRSGSVRSLTLQGDEITGDLSAGTSLPSGGGLTITSFRTEVPTGVGQSWSFLDYITTNRHNAVVNVENSANILTQLLLPLAPWLLIFGFVSFFLFRRSLRRQ